MSKNYLLIKAIRKEKIDRIPVWIMRQAGRYLKEYNQVRQNYDFMEMCKTPEAIVEVSVQPVNIIGVDAGIIFSDILVPVEAMGVKVTFEKNHGPKLDYKIKDLKDVENLKIPNPTIDMKFIGDSIKMFKQKLPKDKPLIGFSGAPWTLSSYILEGGSSKNFTKIKSFMFNKEKIFLLLMEKITETIIKHLIYQIESGADIIQIFDTWAGVLAPNDYEKYAFYYQKKIISSIKSKYDIPIILYINGSGNILEKMVETGADALSIDWMTDLAYAKSKVGDKVSLQGNMDPCYLYGNREFVKNKVIETINKFGKETGYIFNLGHGILPDIPVENVKTMVETVKKY
ncbi:MAG: uroporphyrinogen decarboxylase [Candidatus Sericytochromatia bacterium]|nr:MAG: uroporphyrinogen decarboxylase [Candidatus Sericytochromatia bacterium]